MKTLTLLVLLAFTTALTYSQSVAISQLPAITDSLKQADVSPIVHNGTTRKVTMQQLKTYITGQHTTSVNALSVSDTALFNGSVRINSLPNLTATHLTGIGISDAGFISFQNSLTTADTSNGNLATVHHADSLIHASILSGATGVTGATGLRGATGLNGTTGAAGATGATGVVDGSLYLPLAGGTMTGGILFGTGGQNISQGSFDNGTGGNHGISLNCAIGYELNWQGGHLSSSYNNGANPTPVIIDSTIILSGLAGNGNGLVGINNSGLLSFSPTTAGGLFYVNLNGDTIQTAAKDSIFMAGGSHNKAVGAGGIFGNFPLTGPTVGFIDLGKIHGSSRSVMAGYADFPNGIVNALVADSGSVSLQATNYIKIGGFSFPTVDQVSPSNGDVMVSLNGSDGDSLSFVHPADLLPPAWQLGGNTGINFDTSTFIGTTDASPIVFKVYSTPSGFIQHQTTGSVGFGWGTPHFNYIDTVPHYVNETFLGTQSLASDSVGIDNVAIGSHSLPNLKSGIDNVAVGVNAGLSLTHENYNTLLGVSADIDTGVSQSTAIGYGAHATRNNQIVLSGDYMKLVLNNGDVNTVLSNDGAGNASWQPPVLSGPTGSEPGSPYPGQFYLDTTLTQMKFWNGSAWALITSTP